MSQATEWSVPLSGPVTPNAMADRMDKSFDALLSSHSGASRPDYAVAGTEWVSTATAGLLKYYVYDGTDDRLIKTIDIATGVVTFAGLDEPAKLDTVNTFTKTQVWSKGADVASAAALTLGDDGNYFDVTGTTAITSIATVGVGTVIKLHFDGALTLTHHSTDLVLPGGANITTAAGDEAEFVEYAAGDWRCVNYQKAGGLGLNKADFSASGAAPVYACRAWANFNGSGTVAIRSSGNVSSITDNGTGDYTINFTQAMPDANYAAVCSGAALFVNVRPFDDTTPRTASALRIAAYNTSSNAVVDPTHVSAAIYR